jgi:hypothetical protein
MATFWTSLRGWAPAAWLIDNPLLVREMRRRMRGRSFTWSLIGYLVALGLVSCFIMFSSYPTFAAQLSIRDLIQKVGEIGIRLFWGMFLVEAAIALVVTPMITAGLATAEKEKDTFEFLQVTTLAPGTFVLGCLLTTGIFLAMVFACTLPILGLTFIFGGVSLSDILVLNLILFLISMTISAWGIFNSTSYKRSRTVMGAILLVLVMLPFAALMFSSWVFGGRLGLGFGWQAGRSPLLYGSLAMLALIAALSVAASRRLYDPNNRLFNYRQYLVFFVLALTLLASLILWRLGPAASSTLVSDSDRRAVIVMYCLFGWLLTVSGEIIFFAGRVERGDELWRLRSAHPAFRTGIDAGLVTVLLAAGWLGASLALADAMGNPLNTRRVIFSAAPPLLASLLLVYSLCRAMSVLSETRNRATVGVVASLVLLWSVLPLLGVLISEVSSAVGWAPSAGAEAVGWILRDMSPPPILFRLAEGDPAGQVISPTLITTILAAMILAPTCLDSLRRRLRVSYDDVARPAPEPPAL